MKSTSALKMVDNNKTNGGKEAIDLRVPYIVDVTIKGSTDALYHRWNCEDVETKAKVRCCFVRYAEAWCCRVCRGPVW